MLVFRSLFTKMAVTWGGIIILWPDLSFGMPVASTLAAWTSMERSRGTWLHKKGDLGIQAWIWFDFGWFQGPHFENFSHTLDETYSCFIFVPSRFLRDYRV